MRLRRLPNDGGAARRGRVIGLLMTLGLVATGACSLLVESKTDQCQTNTDCAKFGAYSVCSDGVCTKPSGTGGTGGGSSSSSSGAGGSGDDAGCFLGTPATDPQFLNQCTDAGCEPFDNCARLGLCDDAGLPPLLSPDGGS